MVPIFSATPSELGESSALAELQLLPDQELMSLWEQTQFAVLMEMLLMEMQRRLVSRPSSELFGSAPSDALPTPAPQTSPKLMVVKA